MADAGKLAGAGQEMQDSLAKVEQAGKAWAEGRPLDNFLHAVNDFLSRGDNIVALCICVVSVLGILSLLKSHNVIATGEDGALGMTIARVVHKVLFKFMAAMLAMAILYYVAHTWVLPRLGGFGF